MSGATDPERLFAQIQAEFWACDDVWEGSPAKVAELVRKMLLWTETGNPFFAEAALDLALTWGAPLTPTFKVEIRKAIRARREGARGTWAAVLREHAQFHTLAMMLVIKASGASDDEAAQKAARWADEATGGVYSPKASSLLKVYEDRLRRPGHEASHLANITAETESEKAGLEALRERLKWLETDSRRGSRRGRNRA